jgi:phospholipid/cholesterol/gamma-HCH transport system ATP-binding protein
MSRRPPIAFDAPAAARRAKATEQPQVSEEPVAAEEAESAAAESGEAPAPERTRSTAKRAPAAAKSTRATASSRPTKRAAQPEASPETAAEPEPEPGAGTEVAEVAEVSETEAEVAEVTEVADAGYAGTAGTELTRTVPVLLGPDRPADSPPADLGPIISLEGVTKRFGNHTVLEDITFDVPRGAITAILGPSGTGKSVLLKNIIGLLRPEAGKIWVDGEQIVGMRDHDLYRVRRKFGVLFQDGALFGSMNLYDNIAFPLREHTRKSEREIRQLVLMNAELVGLLDHLHKLPGEVSGGMKKRAGLARAMVMEPEIVLFDEPDSGLDPVRVAYLDELVLTAQHETGATFFIITHNIQSVMRTADYFGVLFRSHLVKFGTKAEMTNSKNPIIQQFLAGRPQGPIGMDEMSEEAERTAKQIEEAANADNQVA